jgi:hypothetical protein
MNVYFQAIRDHHGWQPENPLQGYFAEKNGLCTLGRDAVWFGTRNHA